MRCNNCGWDNPNTLTHCEKCNAPLTGAAQVNHPHIEAAPLNKTINEAVIFDAPKPGEHQPTMPEASAYTCPKFGYPLRPDTSFCPQCGKALKVEKSHTPTPQPASNNSDTINPWVQVTPQSRCTLTPVRQSSDEAAPATVTFKGDTNTLNRANLDAENPTITSQTQAELTYKDGVWYIQDCSQQQTTFVHAGNKTPLHDGDVILMGNRQFIFHFDK